MTLRRWFDRLVVDLSHGRAIPAMVAGSPLRGVRHRRVATALAALGAPMLGLCPASPAQAAVVEYIFGGVVSSKSVYGSLGLQLPSDVTIGATVSGVLKFEDSTPLASSSSAGAYNVYNAVTDFTATIGSTTYSKTAMNQQYANAPRSKVEIYNNLTSGTPGNYLDAFKGSVGSENHSDTSNYRETRMTLDFEENTPSPQAIGSSSLSGLQLDLSKFTTKHTLQYYDFNLSLGGGGYKYMLSFDANITSLSMRTNVGDVSGGTVTVTSGNQIVAGTATGGTIDASAGSAVVSNLAGATLATGAAGATVTTLTSGNITTSGGTITTSGGSFTGSIAGTGALEKTGNGTLTLSNANSYSGGTTVRGGTVEIVRGDAIGSAPVVLVNNGRFKAAAGVDLNTTVVSQNSAATYEKVFGSGESLSNYGTFTDGFSTASLVAGDLGQSATVTSAFGGSSGLALDGLDQTRFLMVMQVDGVIPVGASPTDYYLGWNDPADGLWKLATLGNHGAAGEWAGAYTTSYQSFLDSHGGWNGAKMLGAFGVDAAAGQVWAVIDHNSSFGVTNLGTLVTGNATAVPEIDPAGLGTIVALVTGVLGIAERRRGTKRA